MTDAKWRPERRDYGQWIVTDGDNAYYTPLRGGDEDEPKALAIAAVLNGPAIVAEYASSGLLARDGLREEIESLKAERDDLEQEIEWGEKRAGLLADARKRLRKRLRKLQRKSDGDKVVRGESPAETLERHAQLAALRNELGDLKREAVESEERITDLQAECASLREEAARWKAKRDRIGAEAVGLSEEDHQRLADMGRELREARAGMAAHAPTPPGSPLPWKLYGGTITDADGRTVAAMGIDDAPFVIRNKWRAYATDCVSAMTAAGIREKDAEGVNRYPVDMVREVIAQRDDARARLKSLDDDANAATELLNGHGYGPGTVAAGVAEALADLDAVRAERDTLRESLAEMRAERDAVKANRDAISTQSKGWQAACEFERADIADACAAMRRHALSDGEGVPDLTLVEWVEFMAKRLKGAASVDESGDRLRARIRERLAKLETFRDQFAHLAVDMRYAATFLAEVTGNINALKGALEQ